ncbi:MAG: tetratricopeptide repeat protein [Deltaproteobacteria bacterium]|nr:tetratricopeptide repeat protein [Deltaproteobacteria bacterium]
MKSLNIAIIATSLFMSACLGKPFQTDRTLADQLSEEKKYDEAVAAYLRHIKHRLSVKNRPKWENPHIYLLDIGDLYLDQGNVSEALRYYQSAEEKGVKPGYCNDRYRYVATWYEKQGRLREALEHLNHFESKDPFLFGLMQDRIAKQIVAEEEGDHTK